MDIQLPKGSARDPDSIADNPARLINLYSEPVPATGLFKIKSVLGDSTDYASVSSTFLRALAEIDGKLYAVTGGRLYSIGMGSAVDTGSILDDENTDFSGNFGKPTFVAGGKYFLLSGGTVSEPTAGQFSNFGSVTFVAGYTFLTELNGSQMCWSDPAAPGTLPALNFASAESIDDNIIRAVSLAGNVWVFGEKSIEIWYPTGGLDENAFLPVSGAVIETGLKSFALINRFPNGLFLIGNDGIGYITSGQGLKPVTIPAVETAIKQGTATNCLYYEDEGHKFCVIRFSDRPAWVYDIVTGQWHERATGNGAWDAVVSAKHQGNWLVGTNSGNIQKLDRTNADKSGHLIRQLTTDVLYAESSRFSVSELEFYGRIGWSSVTDVETREVKAILRASKDRGITFGQDRDLSLGKIGQYELRAMSRNWGQFRGAVFQMVMSDPVDTPLKGVARVKIS